MSTYFYEMLLGKQAKKYTENPMTQPVQPDTHIDNTYIIIKNTVDKLSGLMAHPYDYIKHCIIKKDTNIQNECESEESDNNSEEISLITISYDTIYKAEQTDQPESNEDNIDMFVKTASTAYTFVVSTYNDAVT